LIVDAPCPLVEASEIHEAFVLADHAHSRSDVTVSVPVPPAAGSSDALFAIETWQIDGVGPVTFVIADEPHAAKATGRAQSRSAANHRRGRSTPVTYVVCIDA
jgi:hypothetical protein